MTKHNKNSKGKATLDEMVKSSSQHVLMHDDGMEQPVKALAGKTGITLVLCDDE